MKRIKLLLLVMGVLAIIAVSPQLWKHSHKPPVDNIYIEADKNFTYKNLPIHPVIILQLQFDSFESDFSKEVKSDLSILEKNNLYERLPLQIDGNKICISASKEEEKEVFNKFLYEYMGKTDDGLHILIGRDCFEDGIYSTLLFVEFEQVEEKNAFNQISKRTYIILKKGSYLGYMSLDEKNEHNSNGNYQEIDISNNSCIRI